MGLITRPTKTGGSGSYVAGNDILASEANADADTVYAAVNGQLDTNNVKPTAGIKGTQLATAPDGISVGNLNDNAVETAKIKDGAVTTAKLGDLATTGAKVAAATLGTDKLKITLHAKAFTIDMTSGINLIGPTVCRADDSGTNWAGTVSASCDTAGGIKVKENAANPSSSFAKATYDLIAMYVKNLGTGGGSSTLSGTLVYVFISKT